MNFFVPQKTSRLSDTYIPKPKNVISWSSRTSGGKSWLDPVKAYLKGRKGNIYLSNLLTAIYVCNYYYKIPPCSVFP